MPQIDVTPHPDRIFAHAREAVGQSNSREGSSVVLLTPGRFQFVVPCPAPNSMSREHVAPIRQQNPERAELGERVRQLQNHPGGDG
jgi:hypothetical protein